MVATHQKQKIAPLTSDDRTTMSYHREKVGDDSETLQMNEALCEEAEKVNRERDAHSNKNYVRPVDGAVRHDQEQKDVFARDWAMVMSG